MRGHAIPPEFFGMCVLHLDSIGSYGAWSRFGQTPLHDLGYRSYRLWDNDVTWKALEPEKGSFYWDRLDDCIGKLQAANLSILLCLGQPPAWASGSVDGRPGHSRYNCNPPGSIGDWEDYITAIVTRYGAAIQAYEIWNEFDLDNFWTGSEDQMVDLGISASKTIKKLNPSAIIVSPSISTGKTNAPALLGRVASRMADYIDVIGFHSYNSDTPFLVNRNIEFLRSFLIGSLANKPIWTTEFFNVNQAPLDDEDAAGQVVKCYIANWIGGVERAFWWQMGHPTAPSRLVNDTAPGIVLPSGRAYKFFAELIVGGTIDDWSENFPHFSVNIRLANGRSGKVFWTSDGTTAPVNLSGYSVCFDVFGQIVTRETAYRLSAKPVIALL